MTAGCGDSAASGAPHDHGGRRSKLRSTRRRTAGSLWNTLRCAERETPTTGKGR
jgi:hypothetical protein